MTIEELKDIAEGAKLHPLGCSCHGCCQGQDKSPSEKLAAAGAAVLALIRQFEDARDELEAFKKDDARRQANEPTYAESKMACELVDARQELLKLEVENEMLRARPPMHCSTCEDHNQKLWEEVEAHKAFMTRDGREGIALNAYIAGIDDSTNIPVEDLLSSERMQPYIDKFKRWWKGYEDVIELRAKPYVDKVLAQKS